MKLNNLTAQMGAGGNILLTDSSSGEQMYIIPAPIAYDANNAFAPSDKISYSLTSSGNGKYTLTVTADTDWMNSEDRVFPVVVDPAVSNVDAGITNIFVEDPASGADNSGRDTFVKISPQTKVYWKTSILPTVPTSAHIVKATFKLQLDIGEVGYVGIYPITSEWDSSLTWGSTTAGVFSNTMLDYQNIVPDEDGGYSNGGTFYWDITDLYNDWHSGESNYGLGLKVIDGTTSQGTAWFCGNNSVYGNADSPRLTVQYKDMKGFEYYWTYSSQDIGFAGTGNINLATGQLVLTKSLLFTTDGILPFTPTLVYDSSMAGLEYTSANAQVPYSTAFTPVGFKWNMQETIVARQYYDEIGTSRTMYILSDSDGTDHYFMPTQTSTGSYSSTEFADEDGLQLKMEVSETAITITDNAQTVRTYTPIGTSGWCLSTIKDAYGNQIVIGLDSSYRPVRVSLIPNGGTQIDFLYVFYNYSTGMPIAIWNPTSNEAMVFRYSETATGPITTSASKYLRQIEYVHYNSTSSLDAITVSSYYNNASNVPNMVQRATASYTYNSAGQMIRARDDSSGFGIIYDYTSTGSQIAKCSHLASGSPTVLNAYSYKTQYTKIRLPGKDEHMATSDDLFVIYSFDNEGRVKSYYSEDSSHNLIGATSAEYETQENIKNNIKPTVSIGGSPTNDILNGNFELGLLHWTTLNASLYEATSDGLAYIVANKAAKFDVQSNTTHRISQYLLTTTGDKHNISLDISASQCENVSVYLKVISQSNGVILSEELPINQLLTFEYTNMSYSFDNPSTYIRVVIEVVGGDNVSDDAVVYVDNIMLETKAGNSHYSLIQIGDFENHLTTSSWQTTSFNSTYWKNQDDGFLSLYTTRPFYTSGKVESDISREMYLKQIINVATENDKYLYEEGYTNSLEALEYPSQQYVVSGYAKASGTVASGKLRILVRVNYCDRGGQSVEPDEFEFEFLSDYSEWQFVHGSFTTVEGRLVDSIEVICDFSNQPSGTALFDNISLIRMDDEERIEYQYYPNGLLRVKDVGGVEEYYEYNDKKQITLIANNKGQMWEYIYDTDGITLDFICEYDFHLKLGGAKWYPYNNSNPLSLITRELTKQTSYYRNSYGQTTQIIEHIVEDGQLVSPITVSYSYYAADTPYIIGRLKSQSNPGDGTTTCYMYNEKDGRLLAAVNRAGKTGVSYTYDAKGNISSVLPATITSSKDDYTVTQNVESVGYTYNALNQLSSITTESTTYNFTYTTYGDSDSVSVGDTEIVSYEYVYRLGKISKIHYANGCIEEYIYDELDNLSEIWYTKSGQRTLMYSYEYTKYGQLSRFCNHAMNTVTVYNYDTSGRLIVTEEYDAADMTTDWRTNYYYDEQSRISSVYYTVPKALIDGFSSYQIWYNYAYNTDGTLSGWSQGGASDSNSIDVDYTYDEFNRPILTDYYYYVNSNLRISNEVIYEYDYNSHRVNIRQSNVSKHSSSGELLLSSSALHYEYDVAGNITRIYDSHNANNEVRYVYDDMNQLIREDNVALNKTFVYTYDNAGNILTKSVCALTAAGVTPTPAQTYNYTYANTEWGDQLTGYNGESITYDNIGNPITYMKNDDGLYRSMVWSADRRLSAIYYGASQILYRYNDEGIRLYKNAFGVETYYHVEGSRILAEVTDGDMIVYLYDADGSPIGMKYIPSETNAGFYQTYYFEKNLHGDIVAVYDRLGYKVASYVYDAWGNFEATYYNTGISDEILHKNPFLYRGYYYDYETGFYYLNSRYYDPEIGRFISPDSYLSTGQGILGNNMYAYCGNNPVMNVDPNGHFWSEFWEYAKIVVSEIGRAIGHMSPAYAGCVGVSALDGPLPIADIIAFAMASVITAGAIGYGISNAVEKISEVVEDAKKEEIISSPQHSQAIFTPDPYDFNPRGLIRNEYPGSKNGRIIKWHDPATNIPVFEWDEDLTYGAHYHILNNGDHSGDHIIPGTLVPEPWNSIYFGG